MTDIFDSKKRSEVMSHIRGDGNKNTELRMIALFREYKITGWRRKQAVFGKPDFVFRRQRLALFVDGCFWHGCPKPKHASLPKTRSEWWAEKLQRNHKRDILVTRTLEESGWKVMRIWECELNRKNWPAIAENLTKALQK